MSETSKKSWRSWLPEWAHDKLFAFRLQREINSINDRFSPQWESAKNDTDRHHVQELWNHETEWLEVKLHQLGSKRLLRRAKHWGIDVPKDAWVQDEDDEGWYVGPTAQPSINRQIRSEMLGFWKDCTQIVVPILSLLVALAAIYWHR